VTLRSWQTTGLKGRSGNVSSFAITAVGLREIRRKESSVRLPRARTQNSGTMNGTRDVGVRFGFACLATALQMKQQARALPFAAHITHTLRPDDIYRPSRRPDPLRCKECKIGEFWPKASLNCDEARIFTPPQKGWRPFGPPLPGSTLDVDYRIFFGQRLPGSQWKSRMEGLYYSSPAQHRKQQWPKPQRSSDILLGSESRASTSGSKAPETKGGVE
jgi:hypothetical protein